MKLSCTGQLAEALNFEIRDLVDAGCTNIQVDEPLFARKKRPKPWITAWKT